LFPRLCDSLDGSYFKDGRAGELFRTIEDLYQDGRTPKLEDVVSSIRDEGLRRLVLERSASGIFDEKAEMVVEDGIRRLKKRSLVGERREIEAAMARAGDGSPEIMRELLARKIALDKEIDGI
jgi:DNA primase